MKKIIVFVPIDHKEILKESMFKAGAGRIGNYDSCCFETVGVGQFRPLKGSDAFIGSVGLLESVQEVKLEMVCQDEIISSVIGAMKQSHPYETIAYEVYSIEQY
ncbi:NGG1p interacting factor NIF3 [Halobacteriovorax sp. HLS]|uniref:NGG1p interacting factor NIF3 n=1 Tax=Halobacteriovorax sp. HLS TaxID=2234000 RepID=UPI000FDB7ED7|nr:NGG1p interacting factor NIF3 [Halobacteriovorax sp. HLS]